MQSPLDHVPNVTFVCMGYYATVAGVVCNML